MVHKQLTPRFLIGAFTILDDRILKLVRLRSRKSCFPMSSEGSCGPARGIVCFKLDGFVYQVSYYIRSKYYWIYATKAVVMLVEKVPDVW
jgi:hypothetical protein